MKYYKYILISIVSIIAVSCSKPEPKDPVSAFRETLTKEDTTVVLNMCNEAMELMKTKEYDKLLSILHEYNSETQVVSSLSEETIARYRNIYKLFPVLSYELEYYSFLVPGCNDVKYNCVFATAEQIGGIEDAKKSFMFNPVKVNGTWQLCMKTSTDKMDRLHYLSN